MGPSLATSPPPPSSRVVAGGVVKALEWDLGTLGLKLWVLP